ncbi:MAG: serine/threonine-protein kinase [Aridibacter sp.]
MKVCSVCRKCYDDSITNCDFENHKILTQTRQGNCLLVEGYKIDKQIESSPIELYKATHPASEKKVLIRFIKANDLTAELQKELQSVADIDHPNLARVFEFGEVEGKEFYVVLENLEGRNLSEHLGEFSPLSEKDAIKIARQIVEGLEQLHTAGVLHRNVSPENIYFTNGESLEVKLQNYDFGGIIQHNIVQGATGIDAKTEIFRYFSPEQFAGKEVDFKTDIYSLAVVLYEMLLGHSPYESINPQAIADYAFNESDVKNVHHDLRALLAYTLRESLQHRLHLRPHSTNNLASQLRHLELIATPSEIIKQKTPQIQQKQVQPIDFPKANTFIQENQTAGIITPKVIEEKIVQIPIKEIRREFLKEKTPDIQTERQFVESANHKLKNPEVFELSAQSHIEAEKVESSDSEQINFDKIIPDKKLEETEKVSELKIAEDDKKVNLFKPETVSNEIYIEDKLQNDEAYFDEYVESDEFFEEAEFIEEQKKETKETLEKGQLKLSSLITYEQTNSNSNHRNYIYVVSIIAVICLGALLTSYVFSPLDKITASQDKNSKLQPKANDFDKLVKQESQAAKPVTTEIAEENIDSLESIDSLLDKDFEKNKVGELTKKTLNTPHNQTPKNKGLVKNVENGISEKNVKANKPNSVKEIKLTTKSERNTKQTSKQTSNATRQDKQKIKSTADKNDQKVKISNGITRPRIVSDVVINY